MFHCFIAYNRHPLTGTEKTALEALVTAKELPSRKALEQRIKSHALLKERSFKQCYNYLHKRKLKVNRY